MQTTQHTPAATPELKVPPLLELALNHPQATLEELEILHRCRTVMAESRALLEYFRQQDERSAAS